MTSQLRDLTPEEVLQRMNAAPAEVKDEMFEKILADYQQRLKSAHSTLYVSTREKL